MEPVTEQRPVPGLVVYGYLRLRARNQSRRAALTAVMHGYCDQHELILGAVFTDNGSGSARQPGFAGLLDALRGSGGYGVIIPSPAHLGAGPFAAERSAAIVQAGRRLIVVRGALAEAAGRQPR